MHHLKLLLIAFGQAFHMHQAGSIETGHHVRTGVQMVGNAVVSHHAGDRCFVDRKGAAEAATFVGPRQIHEFDATQLGKQEARFIERRIHTFAGFGEAQITQSMATHMKADFAGEIAFDLSDMQNVDQIFAEFVGVRSHVFEARLTVKPLFIVMFDHGSAAAGGTTI